MKRVLLFVTVILAGLFFEDRLNQPSNLEIIPATVTNIEKVKNKKKGGKPFIYKVSVSYKNAFGRTHESSFVARIPPSFKKGATISVAYSPSNPSTVRYKNRYKYAL